MDFESCRPFLAETARQLLTTDSPSGFTARVIDRAESIARAQGYETSRSNKGNLIIDLPGRESGREVGLCAHIDTLGLMVRSITEDGMLKFTRIGGPILPTLDGEYCRIYTRDGRSYTGTVLSLSPAIHVFDDASSRKRDEDNMAVRIDERVTSRADVLALGIAPGDYICFDPKTVITDSGFLKSRFIDDKGSSACLLTLLKLLHDSGKKPRYHTRFMLTVYEEVGHGGAAFPTDLDELLAVDMGCVGLDLDCTEYQVSICAKDSAGPYDYELTSRLISLAKAHGIDYAVDIYPHYSSDASAALDAGRDVRCALIGPGVHASHGMERTHLDAMLATIRLAALYLECE